MATLSHKRPQSAPARGHRKSASESVARMSGEDPAKVSGRIDEEIKKDLSRQKEARKREVKVMLLGQAESGKSTLQKQFQLFYASRSLDVERLSWVPVVYFNIIKAIRMILAEVDHESSLHIPNEPLSLPEVQQDLNSIRIRLLPLLALESTLASELSGGITLSGGRTGAYVRSGWQALVAPTWTIGPDLKKPEAPNRTREVTTLVARTLTFAVDDIDTLWTHETIRYYIQRRTIRLDDCAAFFLDNIQRIGEPEYSPTNDDILHVRLQTLGVMEHSFPITLSGRTYDWKLYDVGGAVRVFPYLFTLI
ncbi:unnamed protein product [Cyclocybe aegerita]|uniref:Uncharacterized protein n=1 Tax=Cyclocybe aegerita TaxID=1973307 RepID=A0A8S0VXG8_CYCAE|nr:unnamed protein product [Cyclocybe aegerita]